jgi:iron complex outermembrane receptor protein
MYSGEMAGLYEEGNLMVNYGADIGYNKIAGMRMNHDRTRLGMFAELIYDLTEKLTLSPGMSGYYYEEWGTQLFPGLDIGYQLTEKLRLFSSIGRSFRLPSFTDLFYSGVANLGNANLKPEKAVSAEMGVKYNSDRLQTSATVFHRNITDMIDFARSDRSDVFVAMNVPERQTTGFEYTFKYLTDKPYFKVLQIKYSVFDHEEKFGNYQLKYALNSLRQSGSVNLTQLFFKRVRINWNVNYSERVFDHGKGQLVTNFQSSLPLKKITIHIKLDNIFDIQHKNFLGRPMPGRWTTLGIKYKF